MPDKPLSPLGEIHARRRAAKAGRHLTPHEEQLCERAASRSESNHEVPLIGPKVVVLGSDVPPAASAPTAHKCGHVIPLAHLAGQPCAECITANRKARRERKKARQTHPEQGHQEKGRLPDLSAFAVWYSAFSKQWTGTLEVIEGDGPVRRFEASASGVFDLLRRLDHLYRESLKEKPCTTEST
jgi:hypothetical protein